MHKTIALFAAVFVTAVVLNACGWHLRGSLSLPSDLDTLYVSARDAHGALITELKRRLQANRIQLVQSADDSRYSVLIIEERDRRRAVSVGSNALAAEYELTLEADYKIEDAADPAASTMLTAHVIRSYSFDANAVVGMGEEEQLLHEEMRRELVQQIVRRLQIVASRTTTSPTAKTSLNGKATP